MTVNLIGAIRLIPDSRRFLIVDDSWATIGSCNLHKNSLVGHSEMNAAIWDPRIARGLRASLFAEHLGQETAYLDDAAALRLYRRIADENRHRRDVGDPDWQGLPFSLDPANYAE
jgi:cardiolipin synthase A/B